ncbi:poly ADP-ribose polymerase [Achlya hypogyna]|uniref:Poly [ADP-ribose] polymerase n=1 Tax=Achlya hypogyna TaxID=1202772 RepID=A0A1V9Z661_ACHHY|nr:poly ADP-ribose polymerase [Achlya hypogyna]
MERVLRKGKAVVDPLSKMDASGTVLQEADGTVWSVMLTLTDVSFGVKGHNKFYSFQIIVDDKAVHKAYVFYKWGRIGAKNPQRKLLGPMTLDAAKENFISKFELKTENSWPLGGDAFEPVSGKYTLIDIDYTDEKEDEMESAAAENTMANVPPTQLPASVHDFVKMICDVDLIAQEMAEMHLDLKRMPLGKLSKQQIAKGYGILDQISETLREIESLQGTNEEDVPDTERTARRRSGRKKALPSKVKTQVAKAKAQLKTLSSAFYTLVPHDFGMNLPPVIDSVWEIKLKLDLLEVLSDVEITQKMIKDEHSVDINPVDAHFASLHTRMDAVGPGTPEFTHIEEYIAMTHAPTHRQYKLKVDAIHRVAREAEAANTAIFDSVGNHQLLWHGSRLANIASILTKGLRIAPPEAPSTGYMFGKGVYFADVASKSANYCWASAAQTKAREVALGSTHRVLEAEEFDYGKLQVRGCDSVFGAGRMTPAAETHFTEGGVCMPKGELVATDADGSLLYNEYVVYRTEQVRLRYVVSVQFDFA